VLYKGVYTAGGKAFPEDPYEQLKLAINAVFDSWQSDRAQLYRAVSNITGLEGTAVNVQVCACMCVLRGRERGGRYGWGGSLGGAQRGRSVGRGSGLPRCSQEGPGPGGATAR
jgi:hypothetical protein